MGKTRDLIKKIRDTKGIFDATMGSIKDRKSLDLTEAERGEGEEKRRTEDKMVGWHHQLSGHEFK